MRNPNDVFLKPISDLDFVIEGKSAKRKAHDRAKRLRLRLRDEEQLRFQKTNEAYLRSTGKLDKNGKLKRKKELDLKPKKQKVSHKVDREQKRKKGKQLIKKMRKDGIIQNYHVNKSNIKIRELDQLKPKNDVSSGYSIAPTKGSGKALYAVSNGKPKKYSEETPKEYRLRVREHRQKNLELIRQYKDNPDKQIAKHFHDEILKSLVLEQGNDAILYNIEQIITPPITNIGDKKPENSLVIQVANMIAHTLGAKYNHNALGFKKFETKKQGNYNNRAKMWESHLKNMSISRDDVDVNGDVLLLDDIMTTGSTNIALKNKLLANSKNHDGRPPVRGKIHTRIILKNH